MLFRVFAKDESLYTLVEAVSEYAAILAANKEYPKWGPFVRALPLDVQGIVQDR